MKQRAILPFFILLMAWSLLGFTPPSLAASPEGKFYLIYLVSTDKVEPGAKAYVEPLFFTDGNKLVFAYDYCRQYYNRTHHPKSPRHFKDDEILPPEKIADDLALVHQYCDNQETTIDLKNYAVHSNGKTALKLDSVTFTPYLVAPADRGVANITNVEGPAPLAPEFKLQGVPQYFFLMSSNKALLDRVAPVRAISESDKMRLDQRWEQYRKDRFARRPTTPPATECSKYWATSNSESIDRERLIRDGSSPVTTVPKVLSLIYEDLDHDVKPDLLAYVLETIKKTGMVTPTTDQVVILIFYGNGREQCMLRNHGDSMSRHTADSPAYLIHIGLCNYMGISLKTQNKSVDLFSLPAESPNCKNRSVDKYETR